MFCALQVFVLELLSFVRFFTSFRDLKNTSLLSSLTEESDTKKWRIIAREHERIWPSADERARCNRIWLRESDTCQHDAALHANTKELDGAQTNGHDEIWPSTAECRWLPKTLIAHTHLLASRKSFRKIFIRSESFWDEKKNIFLKNSSHPRLSATTKRRKGALLMVHFAQTLTIPLRLSSSRFSFVMCYFLSRELEISFDAQAGAMPLLRHCTFSLFCPARAVWASFARKDAHCVCGTVQALHGGSTTTCSLCFAIGKLIMSLKTNL